MKKGKNGTTCQAFRFEFITQSLPAIARCYYAQRTLRPETNTPSHENKLNLMT